MSDKLQQIPLRQPSDLNDKLLRLDTGGVKLVVHLIYKLCHHFPLCPLRYQCTGLSFQDDWVRRICIKVDYKTLTYSYTFLQNFA